MDMNNNETILDHGNKIDYKKSLNAINSILYLMIPYTILLSWVLIGIFVVLILVYVPNPIIEVSNTNIFPSLSVLAISINALSYSLLIHKFIKQTNIEKISSYDLSIIRLLISLSPISLGITSLFSIKRLIKYKQMYKNEINNVNQESK